MKIIRIKMRNMEIENFPAPDEYASLGGRALTSRIISDNVPSTCHPLSAENVLVISNGLLAGSAAPNSGRISIGTKSPLTGGIKESNVGGNCGQYMARMGIRALVVEGAAKKSGGPYVAVVENGEVRLEEKPELKMLGTYEAAEKLQNIYGEKIACLIVGPAGEQKLAAASIMATDLDGRPSRAAGRGGTGAVLGSKGIKAVVCVEPEGNAVKYEAADEFKTVAKTFSKKLIDQKGGLTKYGTAAMVKAANLVDGMPTKNYSSGTFERAEEMNGASLHDMIVERGGNPSRACHTGCVIRCSNIFHDKNGEYVTASLEYETMVMNGSNLDISSLDALAWIDRATDDAGLDTIETGAALGVAMEAGYIKWGDESAVLRLIKDAAVGGIEGKLIGSGAAVVGKVFGVSRVPVVKGQSMVAYDPRTFKGMGCTYATSPMGADHTAGPAIPGRIGLDPSKQFELTDAEGQPELTRDLQIMITVCDSLGYCFFVGPDIENMKRSAVLLNAMYGWNYSYEDVLALGVKTLLLEKQFNLDAGISAENDRLPDFFINEPLPKSGRTFDVAPEKLTGLDYNL